MIIKLCAQLWKMSRDYEDEVTLVFKIPSKQREDADKIPAMKELQMIIETGENE